MSGQSHSAAASALGYLYQVQWPLLELVKQSLDRPDLAITLERFDDVALDDDGSPTKLLQLKNHSDSTRRLTDKNADIWRTIKAWMDTVDVGDPSGPLLCMVTTQVAAPGSAAAFLRPPDPGPRKTAEAQALLESAANTSTDKDSAEARAEFLALSSRRRRTFVARIHVLDLAPHIEDLDAMVRRGIGHGLPRGHEDTFMGLLWGWWHGCAVDLLRGSRRSVSGLEVAARIDDLRDSFTHDNLPTLVGAQDFDQNRTADYDSRGFVKQMHWVGAPPLIIEKAIVDYYRAWTQSAAWIDAGLVDAKELEAFENRIRDEWERDRAWAVAELPENADESEKRVVGRELLKKALDTVRLQIRARYDDPFFCRGKHHELADAGDIGWHPDFEEMFDSLVSRLNP